MKKKWTKAIVLCMLLGYLVVCILQVQTGSSTVSAFERIARSKSSGKVVATESGKAIISTVRRPNGNAQFRALSLKDAFTPQYESDSNGIYPKNSWVPTGNQSVINHPGKQLGNDAWDNEAWDGDPKNLKNSYIEYGQTKTDIDFAIRKYAKETQTPGLYDVFLNIRGNEQKQIDPIDIILVVDMSGSMEPENNPTRSNRAQATRDGVKQFLQAIRDAGMAEFVNVGLIGFSSPGYFSTGSKGYIEVGIDSVSNSRHISNINNKLSGKFSGATFTQLGIRKGTELLMNASDNNKKKMILLTDGVPTLSYKVTAVQKINGALYGTAFANNKDEPRFTSQLWDLSWGSRYPVSYDVSGFNIQDTWAATLGEAKITKDKGVDLHALGIQLEKDFGYTENNRNTYLTQEQVRKNMSLLATSGHYRDASSASEVQMYLKEQAKNVIERLSTIQDGIISDPIGKQFKYKDTVVDVSSVGAVTVDNLPSTRIEKDNLAVSNLNLGKNQEVQIHYQIRLNTETGDFIPNRWYQMNGKTTLTPNGKDPTTAVEFGIPSAKGLGTKIELTKLWEEADGDKSTRPASVTYEVKRTNTTIDTAWKTGFATIEGKNDQDVWTKSVQQLLPDKKQVASLWLPTYNTNGEAFKYSVIGETSVRGYNSVQINDTTIKNVKQFNPLKLAVTKTDSIGKNLGGATFKLVNSKNEEVSAEIDVTGSVFTYLDLSAGNYTLTEINAPDGYIRLETPLKIEILPNATVKIDNRFVKVDNGTIHLSIPNQPKGILPQTGGFGRGGFWMIGTLLFSLTIIASLIYFYRYKRNYNRQKNQCAKKISKLILLLLFNLLPLYGLDLVVNASTPSETISFILHKRVFKESEKLKSIENTGLIADPVDENYSYLVDDTTTYGLNDVTFESYDATEYVKDKLVTMSQDDLQKYITNTDVPTLLAEIAPYQSKIQDMVTKQEGNEDGVAKLSVVTSSENNAYLFVETKISDSDVNRVKMTATPMLVMLPVQNPVEKNKQLTTIHLYPKNTQQINSIPPVKPKPPEPVLPQTGEVGDRLLILGSIIVMSAAMRGIIHKKKR